jgi:hypothetical protein
VRSLTSGISGQLATSGAFAGWLVEFILTNGQAVRVTSLDDGFSYNGLIFAAADLSLPTLSWDGSVLKPGKLIIGDPDCSFWTLAAQLLLGDAVTTIWSVYHDALGEAEGVWQGRAGQVVRNADNLTVEITLANGSDTLTAPRTQVQDVVDPRFLIAPGTIVNAGGQKRIVPRASTSLSDALARLRARMMNR